MTRVNRDNFRFHNEFRKTSFKYHLKYKYFTKHRPSLLSFNTFLLWWKRRCIDIWESFPLIWINGRAKQISHETREVGIKIHVTMFFFFFFETWLVFQNYLDISSLDQAKWKRHNLSALAGVARQTLLKFSPSMRKVISVAGSRPKKTFTPQPSGSNPIINLERMILVGVLADVSKKNFFFLSV